MAAFVPILTLTSTDTWEVRLLRVRGLTQEQENLVLSLQGGITLYVIYNLKPSNEVI